ncbi:MAG: hypothetical protein C0507_13065 [Cyanobacteria bacterium PR.3.49]|nr:hypothetical protein [Cyanobacteria bacterium PR.3.49]
MVNKGGLLKKIQILSAHFSVICGVFFTVCAPANGFTTQEKEFVKADLVLNFRSLDEIDIGISREVNGVRKPRYFKRKELKQFLDHARRKKMLLVCIPKDSSDKREIGRFLRQTKFKAIKETSCNPSEVFSLRTKAPKNRNFPDVQMAGEYYRTRELVIDGTADQIDLGIDQTTERTIDGVKHYGRIYPWTLFTCEETLSFLKQDCQNSYLLIRWSIYARASNSDEEKLRTMAEASKFPFVRYKEDKCMFDGEPTIIESP